MSTSLSEIPMKHGTRYGYKRGCRCAECRAAIRAPRVDHDRLSDLLAELFPDGLTHDCPARRAKAAAA